VHERISLTTPIPHHNVHPLPKMALINNSTINNSTRNPNWWKNATCYQIWPASYKDSNGDGFGDIPGIISTLDYLADLGVDLIWLSPMYDSPQHDMGYDISNYEDVWPKFGTLQDMEKLIEEVHRRGMKLILDLVVNHSSNEHPWFLESKSSKDNPKHDWYIWRDPKYDAEGKRQPPSNWRAIFGGSAWEYVPERDQYYLHLFVPQQPDLNWENEKTRRAIYKSAIEFWLDRGIDGFRVDTVNLYCKDTTFPDAEVKLKGEPWQPAFQYFHNGPKMHEWLKEQRKEVLDKYGDVVMVGELPGTQADEVLRYVSAEARELDMVFDFDIVGLGGRHSLKPHQIYKHKLPEMKSAFMKTQGFLTGTDAWTTVFAENHDQGRSLSRFATDEPKYRVQAAKMFAIMLGTLSGTLFLFQGQEIGMVNSKDWKPDQIKDVAAGNYWKEINEMYPGDEKMQKAALAGIQKVGRDNSRTPVHWSAGPHAGFSTVKPWIRVNDTYPEINVEAQQKDPDSVLAFWKRVLKLRKEHSDVLVQGNFEVHDYENLSTFTYIKEKGCKKVLVVLNFTNEEQPVNIPETLKDKKLELLIGSVEKPGDKLAAWEGRAYIAQ
jgi:oligo-1,6-glucosidase